MLFESASELVDSNSMAGWLFNEFIWLFFVISGEWIYINGKYYHFSKRPTKFSRAETICMANGGKLFEPKTESANNEIHNNLLEQMEDDQEQ